MKSIHSAVKILLGAVAMGILILDAGTALQGAAEGIALCLRSVIPSLFPFLILSGYLTGNIIGSSFPFSKYLCKFCRIPMGSEGILLTGLLGGYPTGARSVSQAYEAGKLTLDEAQRMLGFCSNAGPAFVFGMLGPCFSTPAVLWILWGIHILSAVIVGILLPGKNENRIITAPGQGISFPSALERAVRTMAVICGWVVLFRVIITFTERWFLWVLPQPVQILFCGLLELTNGCLRLAEIDHEATRFMMACLFLTFGGICIGTQTISVTKNLGTGMYFPGKLLQASVSVLICGIVQPFLFPGSGFPWILPTGIIFSGLLLVFLHIRENNSSNFELQGV